MKNQTVKTINLPRKALTKLFTDPEYPIQFIEQEFSVTISVRGCKLSICGHPHDINVVANMLDEYVKGNRIHFNSKVEISEGTDLQQENKVNSNGFNILGSEHRKKSITPRTDGQKEYLDAIRDFDIVFGIGPAGTGKTYLAVAAAIWHLTNQLVNRIVLVRPAVEAGEKLGFLPGDISAKFDPYVRPIYDAMFDMLEPSRVELYIQNRVIEIAPLAFMRGRTLNSSFVILDEGQNTLPDQMKMFLTRLGHHSKMVVTGDATQIDLPNKSRSGLLHAQRVLQDVEEVKIIHLSDQDVVRHKIVKSLINAYEKAEKAEETLNNS